MSGRARGLLCRTNVTDCLLERGGHLLMHLHGIAALDEIWRVAIADEQRLQFLVADAGQDRWVRDLVAVEIQDRQDGAITHGIEKLVRVPRRRQWPGLGLTITDDARDDEIGVVE